ARVDSTLVGVYVPWFCFFFQAEDGIRDGHVTGVQTCALPISCVGRWPEWTSVATCRRRAPSRRARRCSPSAERRSTARSLRSGRSEERRVGKECRSRVSPYE